MFFLVFEGLDGSGKSSLMTLLENHLKAAQQRYIRTREPGGTPLGDQIRELILSKEQSTAPVAKAELLLYQASRAQHVEKIIRPALTEKKWVLCDRFSASSLAFQGGGRNIETAQVDWLNQFATSTLVPDLTILLDLSVEESKKRRTNRSLFTGEVEDRIESESDQFHEKVRHNFLQQARQAEGEPKRWIVLNAALSPEQLFDLLIGELRGRKWLQ